MLWVPAATREELISGYVAIAKALQLPEQDEQDQTKIVQAVMYWLATQAGWLLIYDNADDLSLAQEFQPSLFRGHILLTTRAQSMGRRALRVEVVTMPADVGALFLLRRASLLVLDVPLEEVEAAVLARAKELSEEVGGLPLALDQAGAYIEETHCDLSDYLQRYRTHQAVLLKRRGGIKSNHPNLLQPHGLSRSRRWSKPILVPPSCCAFVRFSLLTLFLKRSLHREQSTLGQSLHRLQRTCCLG